MCNVNFIWMYTFINKIGKIYMSRNIINIINIINLKNDHYVLFANINTSHVISQLIFIFCWSFSYIIWLILLNLLLFLLYWLFIHCIKAIRERDVCYFQIHRKYEKNSIELINISFINFKFVFIQALF